jgi:hypothetical protein
MKTSEQTLTPACCEAWIDPMQVQWSSGTADTQGANSVTTKATGNAVNIACGSASDTGHQRPDAQSPPAAQML